MMLKLSLPNARINANLCLYPRIPGTVGRWRGRRNLNDRGKHSSSYSGLLALRSVCVLKYGASIGSSYGCFVRSYAYLSSNGLPQHNGIWRSGHCDHADTAFRLESSRYSSGWLQTRTNLTTSSFSCRQSFESKFLTGTRNRLMTRPISDSSRGYNFYMSRRHFSWDTIAHYVPLAPTGMCSFHDWSGLPWWVTIVAVTCMVKLCLFPVAVLHQRSMHRYARLKPVVAQQNERIRAEVAHHQSVKGWSKNYARGVFKLNKANFEKEMLRRENCHPARGASFQLIQMGAFVATTVSLRMVAGWSTDTGLSPYVSGQLADIMSPCLTSEGLFWCTNFVCPDTTLVLTALYAITSWINVNFFLTRLLRTPAPDGVWKKFTAGIVLNFVIVFAVTAYMTMFSAYLPAAISFYWTLSNVVTLGQNLILHHPKVKKPLKILGPKIEELFTINSLLKDAFVPFFLRKNMELPPEFLAKGLKRVK